MGCSRTMEAERETLGTRLSNELTGILGLISLIFLATFSSSSVYTNKFHQLFLVKENLLCKRGFSINRPPNNWAPVPPNNGQFDWPLSPKRF